MEDPSDTLAREELAKSYFAEKRARDQKKKLALEKGQAAVGDFLKKFRLNLAIRRAAYRFDRDHKYSRLPEGQKFPLDGEALEYHDPAFVIEHPSGVPGFPRSIEYPGYHYELRFGARGRAYVTATACADESGQPYLVVHLTHVHGLTHEVNWDEMLVNPESETQVEAWIAEALELLGYLQLPKASS